MDVRVVKALVAQSANLFSVILSLLAMGGLLTRLVTTELTIIHSCPYLSLVIHSACWTPPVTVLRPDTALLASPSRNCSGWVILLSSSMSSRDIMVCLKHCLNKGNFCGVPFNFCKWRGGRL